MISSMLAVKVNPMAVTVFAAFVAFVLVFSFYMARKAKSASGYFAAGGQIHWAVNGVSFAGDYLSAASFLGICGMIATAGYDGFLYSIGYLAGWIVALFVVAEPMKRLGKYTFTDALDNKFNSKGIQLMAAISTLVVSVFYLIPQMVGAGTLVVPLLGLPFELGVIMVGLVVIFIVATAGMTSTTYVQFLKGGLLIICSIILVVCVCNRGLSTDPKQADGSEFYKYETLAMPADVAVLTVGGEVTPGRKITATSPFDSKSKFFKKQKFFRISSADGHDKWFTEFKPLAGPAVLRECQWHINEKGSRTALINNGGEAAKGAKLRSVGRIVKLEGKDGKDAKTGALSPWAYLGKLSDKETVFCRWKKVPDTFELDGKDVHLYYSFLTTGNRMMVPGGKFNVRGTMWQKLDFASLMLALFCGTAALPHILIRYYTVPSPACARKSTIVAIAAIGLFYVLTLFMGIGAAVNNVVNVADGNQSAPLLAASFGTFLFAIICAIAFATVLGTVSGLIVAASGAVAHDLMGRYFRVKMSDKQKVMFGKLAAIVVGVIAIVLGIAFKGMNVSFLVGWAFAVAASANLPAIVMLLFWKKTTAKGIVVSILVGMVSSLGIILLSPTMFAKYGMAGQSPLPFGNPAMISIPLSFLTLVVVSLMTQKDQPTPELETAE